MSFGLRFASTIISLILLTSCSSNHSGKVEEIEPMLIENPDSALTMLTAINTATLPERDRAIHNILLTQATDKTSEDYQTNDSLARAALAYFESHSGDDHYKMLCLYYIGQIAMTNEQYGEALSYLLECAHLASNLDDHLNLALTYRTIHDLFINNYFGEDAKEYARLAQDEFAKAGDKGAKYLPWAENDLAIAYHYCAQYDSSLIVLDRLIPEAQVANNQLLAKAAWGNRALSLLMLGKRDSAAACVDTMLSILPDRPLNTSELECAARVYAATHQYDKAKHYSELFGLTGGEYTYSHLEYAAMGNYQEAYYRLLNNIKTYNSLASGYARSTLLQGQRNAFDKEIALNEARLADNRLKLLLWVIALSLVIISLVVYLYIKNRENRLETDLKVDEIDRLLKLNIRQKEEIAHLEESKLNALDRVKELESRTARAAADDSDPSHNIALIRSIYFDSFKEIEDMWVEYTTSRTEENAKTRLLSRFKGIIDKHSVNSDFFKAIEKAINSQFGNLLDRLKADFPKIKDDHYFVYVYSVLGFIPQTIALMLGKGINRIYEIKKQLKANFLKKGPDCLEPYHQLYVRKRNQSDYSDNNSNDK